VIAQLIALPEKELKLFKKFVGSLTNNKKDSICRLYEFLAKNHPVYDEKKFTKRACFLHVFPELKPKLNQLNGKGDELITKKLKNPLYELKNLVDDFIIQQELATQSHEKTILLAKGLFKRQMHDKAFQLIDKELKRLEGMVGEDFYHHFYQFQLMELKQNNVMDKVKEASNLAHHALQHLDMFFTHSKLKLGYELTNRKRLLGEKIDIFLYDALLELIQERNHIKVTPSILMFKNLSQLNSEVSFDVYKKVKQY